MVSVLAVVVLGLLRISDNAADEQDEADQEQDEGIFMFFPEGAKAKFWAQVSQEAVFWLHKVWFKWSNWVGWPRVAALIGWISRSFGRADQ